MNTNILIRWISVFLVGVGLFLTMLFSKGNYNLYGLVDAFFIPGGVLVCVGVLGWVAQNGQFDIFSYGFGSVFHRAFKYNEPLRDKDLPEYKERKERERIYWRDKTSAKADSGTWENGYRAREDRSRIGKDRKRTGCY